MSDLKQRILASGRREVELPSGLRLAGRLPQLEDLVMRGVVNQDLTSAAMKLHSDPTKLFSLPDFEERRRTVEYVRILASQFVQEAWNDQTEQWEPLTLTVDELERLDPDDVAELEWMVLRLKTPAQVTAEVQLAKQIITGPEATAIFEREAASTVAGWLRFRSVTRGLARRPDSGRVEDPAVRAPGDNRASRRARRRSSAGPPPPT